MSFSSKCLAEKPIQDWLHRDAPISFLFYLIFISIRLKSFLQSVVSSMPKQRILLSFSKRILCFHNSESYKIPPSTLASFIPPPLFFLLPLLKLLTLSSVMESSGSFPLYTRNLGVYITLQYTCQQDINHIDYIELTLKPIFWFSHLFKMLIFTTTPLCWELRF